MNSPHKKFAAFDIDGTIFRSGLYREVVYELLALELAPAELRDAFAHHETKWKARQSPEAFSEYEEAMAVAFSKALPKIKCADFDEAVQSVFTRTGNHVYAYTRDLVAQLKREGYTLIAISGSQEELVKLFAEKYGFDIWIGQHYGRTDDGLTFTGEINFTHNGKDKLLRGIAAENNLDFADSIAVGDSRGDIGMLSIVDNPIAFNPERALFDHAKEAGWSIVIERKNMIYKLERNGNTFILA